MAVGAAIGLIFPPSILVGGLLWGWGWCPDRTPGGGHVSLGRQGSWRDASKDSEAALIVVGEATIERAVDDATRRAKKQMKKEMRADAREMERAVNEV